MRLKAPRFGTTHGPTLRELSGTSTEALCREVTAALKAQGKAGQAWKSTAFD